MRGQRFRDGRHKFSRNGGMSDCHELADFCDKVILGAGPQHVGETNNEGGRSCYVSIARLGAIRPDEQVPDDAIPPGSRKGVEEEIWV